VPPSNDEHIVIRRLTSFREGEASRSSNVISVLADAGEAVGERG